MFGREKQQTQYPFSRAHNTVSIAATQSLRPRLHEQIKPPLIAQILDPYEVTLNEFAQIEVVFFAHVNATLGMKEKKGRQKIKQDRSLRSGKKEKEGER